jgi:hypothetical protein
MFKSYMLALLVAFTAVLSVLGYALCFEATTIGGYLPFALIVVGPLFGWLLSKASSASSAS